MIGSNKLIVNQQQMRNYIDKALFFELNGNWGKVTDVQQLANGTFEISVYGASKEEKKDKE